MHKVLILACYAVFISCSDSKSVNSSETSDIYRNNNATVLSTLDRVVSKTLNQVKSSGHLKSNNDTNPSSKNGTLLKASVQKVFTKNQVQQVIYGESNVTENVELKGLDLEHKHHSKDKVHKSIPMLQKIHARITRSKNAVWATITLTALCIILVLSVAQSRMWKDHYYTESQGVPLPNFNERVLFKDVMERKISSLKQFFKNKKHTKEKNETELESLLPSSEWD